MRAEPDGTANIAFEPDATRLIDFAKNLLVQVVWRVGFRVRPRGGRRPSSDGGEQLQQIRHR
jgi:hypothetical protein